MKSDSTGRAAWEVYKAKRAIERKAERTAAYPAVLKVVIRVLKEARRYEDEAAADLEKAKAGTDWWMIEAAKKRSWKMQAYAWFSIGQIRQYADGYQIRYESPTHHMEWPVDYLEIQDQTLMVEKAVRQLVKEGNLDHALGYGAPGSSRANKESLTYRWIHEEERS